MTQTDADNAGFQPQKLVEAALFSAGRPLSIQELAEATHLQRRDVVQGLKDLRDELGSRITSLEVIRAGEKYALQLKAEYAERARMLVPAEIPKHVLKTLALIAYHQPIEQAELKDLVGSKVYEHTGTLEDHGLIRKAPSGLTYELTTTPEFPEYFGIDGLTTKEIRAFLAEKLGLVTGREETPPPNEADAQTTLDEAQGPEVSGPTADGDGAEPPAGEVGPDEPSDAPDEEGAGAETREDDGLPDGSEPDGAPSEPDDVDEAASDATVEDPPAPT